MIQVRFHARGGHGVKTASRILGAAAFFDGYRAQDSPIYGAERRGAAVVAFTRISRHEIRDRGAMPQPDLIVVGDDSLIADRSAGVLSGVESASALFINSPQPQAVAAAHDLEVPVAGVDLTALTVEHLGRATAMSAGLAAAAAALAGSITQRALVRAVRAELSGLREAMIERNVELATAVFDALPAMEPRSAAAEQMAALVPASAALHHIGWEGSLRSAPSILTPGNSTARATGSWRIERPEIDLEQCTACSLCFVRCPDGAIELDDEGYPVIDYEHCKGCMICLETCPLHAVTSEREVRAW